MMHCAKDHPHISWEEDMPCPFCLNLLAWDYEAKVDADLIKRLKKDIVEMKEKCICGKLAE